MIRKIAALILVFVMMALAAISVNHKIFGVNTDKTKSSENLETRYASNDSIINISEEGYIINTTTLSDAIGFASETPLEIYISNADVITEVKALPNEETPDFFNRASTILSEWKGMSVEEAMSYKVDAVSGATMSSNAIIDNFNAGISYFSKSNIPADNNNSSNVTLKFIIALITALMAAILPLFIHNKLYHTIQMILNVGILGFWCGNFVSYSLILGYMSNGLSSIFSLTGLTMLIVAFIYPLFNKHQYYCTHVCPLGSLQQLAGMVKHHKIHISTKVVKFLNNFRRLLWVVLMICLWFSVWTEWINYELFTAFMVTSASTTILICGALVVMISIFIPRPYCRFVCPTGSLMKFQERISKK